MCIKCVRAASLLAGAISASALGPPAGFAAWLSGYEVNFLEVFSGCSKLTAKIQADGAR